VIRSLPFSDPQTLAEVRRPPAEPLEGRAAFVAWASQSTYLHGAAVFSTLEVKWGGQRGALRVRAAETSANLFELLGTKPLLGRSFAAEEDSPGRPGLLSLDTTCGSKDGYRRKQPPNANLVLREVLYQLWLE
jgi:hypothetical protein